MNLNQNQLYVVEKSPIIESPHGSYKALSEDIDLTEKVLESPKKDRFRDKVRSKLKIKTSKSSADIHSDNASIKSNNEEDNDKYIVFGCNLEKVEKDAQYKDVPKLIVNCINVLELDCNIKTPGIYRISGNKMTIDSIKKKFNDKKQPKKESKYACLTEQADVHTLTGLLKMFFRELNPPLMSSTIFSQCTSGNYFLIFCLIVIINNLNSISERHSPTQMRKILMELSSASYSTLKYLFKHLKRVERYQEENLMSSGKKTKIPK